jgi:hypothetical protein
MATLRPLFRSFLARSQLFGGSTGTKELSSSHAWLNANRPPRAGYFRGGGNGRDGGAEELGLRSDIGKGVGVTTVIKSANDEHSGKGRNKSIGNLNWKGSADFLKDDSSEEFLPMQKPRGDWGVRKTTEVVTSQERDTSKEFDVRGRRL